MSGFDPLGLDRPSLRRRDNGAIEHVILQRPLDRILAFTGFSIDDVVNDPIAKNAVRGYFKLHKQIVRTSEIVDLERQWNAIPFAKRLDAAEAQRSRKKSPRI